MNLKCIQAVSSLARWDLSAASLWPPLFCRLPWRQRVTDSFCPELSQRAPGLRFTLVLSLQIRAVHWLYITLMFWKVFRVFREELWLYKTPFTSLHQTLHRAHHSCPLCDEIRNRHLSFFLIYKRCLFLYPDVSLCACVCLPGGGRCVWLAGGDWSPDGKGQWKHSIQYFSMRGRVWR